MRFLEYHVWFLIFCAYVSCYDIFPGPEIVATKGEVWPKPQRQQQDYRYMIIQPGNFKFEAVDKSCLILHEAFDRYIRIIHSTVSKADLKRKSQDKADDEAKENNAAFEGYLTALHVKLSRVCKDNEVPDSNLRERYNLTINNETAILRSESIWGILRGLETFSQLLYPVDNRRHLLINYTTISDYPRYKHRGLLLDTSRHFLPISIIKQVIDVMAYVKLNILHWHVVDDQSFPYQSRTFPQLSLKGAYHKSMVYFYEDARDLIVYASKRGIRIMPEFDTPAHTRSWGLGIPELLTECYTNGNFNGLLGPINPTRPSTYTFLRRFFLEVLDTFFEQHVHLGGDHVDFLCWESNPVIKKWMEIHNMRDGTELQEYYIQKLVDIIDDLNATSVVWQDVLMSGIQLPKKTIVQVYNNGFNNNTLNRLTRKGYRAIWSAYRTPESNENWEIYYDNDPQKVTPLNSEQSRLVIGGEICIWGEKIDESNLVQTIWPNAAAVAEKLWSSKSVSDIVDARKRLEELSCRMKKRGIPCQPPNGSGFCVL